jgi:hypothetical protein
MRRTISFGEAPRAKARACTPKCRPAVGRRYGTQAWLLHKLRRAEPSEAQPTALLRSFEGYPPRIHPRSKDPCLRAEVCFSTQAWLSAYEGERKDR